MRNAIDTFLMNAVAGVIAILTLVAMLKIFFLLG